MSSFVDIERQLGDDWQFEQICQDASGAPLRIVDLRFILSGCVDGVQTELMRLDLASGAVTLVTDGSDGLAMITISPARQQADIPGVGLYAYETTGVLADGTPSIQNYGGFNVCRSLTAKFPN